MIRASHYNKEEEENLLLIHIEHHLSTIYPHLNSIGFEKSQLQDVIQSWKANNLNLEHLSESLQRAEYAIENKSFQMDDPLNYIYKSLMKGTFRKPPGFKTRAELQAEEILSEQKRISEMKDEAFVAWCENLPPKKRAEYCKGIPKIKHRVQLREIFDRETA
jgi:hypothetical protein